jgi:DNA-binding PucR family transcriptional regulator
VSVSYTGDGDLREHLSAFRPLLALSMVMTDTADEDEIIRLATTAIPSLGPFGAEAVSLDGAWWPGATVRSTAPAVDLERQLESLDRAGERLDLAGATWAWGYPLVSLDGISGYFVVTSDTAPDDRQQFLVGVLVQQTAAALANARLHAKQRRTAERLQTTNLALERSADEAARSMAVAHRSLAIHDRLTRVAAAGEGQHGIAVAVHELTGRPVAIEDRYGNLIAAAGPGVPDPYPKDLPDRRERLLRRLREAGQPLRDGGRLLVLARAGDDDEGVIAVGGSDATETGDDDVVLEHAATVLALELAHLRGIAEAELRLRRDLVEELLSGTDVESARERAHALGYDLDRPHRVVVVTGSARGNDRDALFHAVRRAARDHDIGSLLVARSGAVAVLSGADADWNRFREAIDAELGPSRACRIGVSEPCDRPDDFPRAYGQAQLALKMQVSTGSPEQVTVFEDLGVYKLLAEIADIGSVERFVQRWLGALLDYDAAKGGQLVETLTAYLECGGSYDATARAISTHRSTLRYRLQRVREIGGYDLSDPDTRFNLQLATRAWTTIVALRRQ